jgi:hypothetical protein
MGVQVILIILLLIASALFSQVTDSVNIDSTSWTISGIAVDEESGLFPIGSYAKMKLDNETVIPDSEGNFTITVTTPGAHILTVESQEYTGEEKKLILEQSKLNIFVAYTLRKRPKQGTVFTIKHDSVFSGRWLIIGFVVDDKTELPFPDAELYYDSRFVPLDKKGSFRIMDTVSGLHSFKVQRTGCQTLLEAITLIRSVPEPFIVLRVTDTGRVPVKREIVVSAKRESLHNTVKPGSVAISRSEIERSAAIMNDPMRVLQTLPGVSATSDLNSRPVVRGGDVLETRVAMDGIPLLQPYHFGGFRSIFNAAAMEKITLHRDEMPAQYHNALSAITAVEARNPARENKFDLAFDVNMLQYNAYMNVPLIKDKLGLNISSQGSYMDWTMRRIMEIALDGDDLDQYKSSIQFPDYQDYAMGLGLTINPQTKLFINGLYNTDKYHMIEPESLVTYNVYFPDGTDSIMTDSKTAYDNDWYYYYEPYFVKYDTNGSYLYPDSSRKISTVFQPDTEMYYRQNYSVVYGLLEHQRGAEHILRTSVAWQRRDWDISFSEDETHYDVKLDQYNLAHTWIYSGINKHLLNTGLQIDYTKQTYDVNVPRILHEMIVKGSTNYADMWGPVTGDSGYSPMNIADLLDDTTGSDYYYFNDLEARINLNYKGMNNYLNAALYASDKWTLRNNLTLNLGLRAELSMIDTSFTLSPRISANYSRNANDEWHASIGHYTQNNYDFSHVALSEQLQPEKAWHFSAGWTHQFLPWLKQELSVYHKYYYDLISEEITAIPDNRSEIDIIVDLLMNNLYYGNSNDRDQYRIDLLNELQQLKIDNPDEYQRLAQFARINGNDYKSTYSNSGFGFSQGVEYFLRYDPADFWSGWLSISLARSMRTRKEGWQSHAFPLDRTLLISMTNYYRLPRAYEISLRTRYMSGIPYTDVKFTDESFYIGPYNAERYAAYLRFDFRISKAFRVAGHKCRWYTELWNAFNTPNAFLRDRESDYIKSIDMNFPVPVLFMGIDFAW